MLVGFPAPKSSVLDVSVAADIRALGGPGEPDVFSEVARLFLADVPIHLSALGAAIAADEKESVQKIAHRLRGGALEIGAVRMAPVGAAIERAACAGWLEDAAAQADSLSREFALVRQELEQMIESTRQTEASDKAPSSPIPSWVVWRAIRGLCGQRRAARRSCLSTPRSGSGASITAARRYHHGRVERHHGRRRSE